MAGHAVRTENKMQTSPYMNAVILPITQSFLEAIFNK
jgi:hypothetical protein